ncbi:MAG: hypothetical protein M1391_02375 [Bacteroidetes bacterium]|nr:hypothetical protein [Bacteroidota bacterium]
MKFIKVIFLSLVLFLQFISCKDTGTGPNQKPFKDPMQMTWTVDTLLYPGSIQTLMTSIWASSPNNVYACGHCDDSRGSFWHYDGKKWDSINLFNYIAQGSLTLQKITGSSDNDFWVVGGRNRGDATNFKYGSFILQNNGTWKDHILNYKTVVTDVIGSSSNLWACGTNGLVFYYNGYSWRTDIIKPKILSNSSYVLSGIAIIKNELLITSSITNSGNNQASYYLIRGNIGNWSFIDSMVSSNNNTIGIYKWGNKRIFQSSWGSIYSYGTNGVWIWNDNLNQWLQLLIRNNNIQGLQGASSNYLLAATDFGLVFYYNGSEWSQLNNLVPDQSDLQFYDVWTNGEEIFLLGLSTKSYPMKTLVLHGK